MTRTAFVLVAARPDGAGSNKNKGSSPDNFPGYLTGPTCAVGSFRRHLIWLGKVPAVAGIVERLVPDELWELFQR
ncbi:hypothetical protein, partial [Streptomyces sp. NPDC091219]|uniref:hypothetical protein n=1 Tax=Streptomyces sp. NPDC091219 TaxID=3155193 RepID=UPI00344EE2BC